MDIRPARRAFGIPATLLITALLQACGKEDPGKRPAALEPAPKPAAPGEAVPEAPSRVESRLAIARIDGAVVDPSGMAQTGRQSVVEWTTSREDVVTCLLVHPIKADKWWVQPLPTLPDKASDTAWSWKANAYFGTEDLGTDEQYEVLAVAEAAASVCVPAREIEVGEANRLLRGYARSAKVAVKRVRP